MPQVVLARFSKEAHGRASQYSWTIHLLAFIVLELNGLFLSYRQGRLSHRPGQRG